MSISLDEIINFLVYFKEEHENLEQQLIISQNALEVAEAKYKDLDSELKIIARSKREERDRILNKYIKTKNEFEEYKKGIDKIEKSCKKLNIK